MKRALGCLAATVLVCALFVGANYCYGQLRLQDATKKEHTELLAPAVRPVDTAYLAYYGIEPFVSNLPVIMLDTDDAEIIKESATQGRIAVLDSGENDITSQDFSAQLYCTVKLRGASSYSQFDKQQYRITLYKKQNGNKKYDYPLCGLPADSEWVLYGPYLDKTAVRNALAYTMADQMELWAPKTQYAEVFVNGEYQGLYLVTEPVTESPQRTGLFTYAMSSGQTAYLLKRERDDTETEVIDTYGKVQGLVSNALSIEYPSESRLTNRQRQWITDDISAFEQALYADYFADETIGYAKYIDVDSFVDYYLLNEFVMNHDAGLLSTYLYKNLNGKIKMAVWDYNNAFDNYQWFIMEPDEFHLNEVPTWWNRLLQDPTFVKKVCDRYAALRGSLFSTNLLYALIDESEARIACAAARNDQLWGYTYQITMLTNVGGTQRNPATRAEAVAQLKRVIAQRLAFFDSHLEDLSMTKEAGSVGG